MASPAGSGLAPSLRRALAEVVGAANVHTDADLRAGHERDWTGRFTGRTDAVVRPAATAEVAGVLAACRAAGVAVVPQGGNTGLVGGAVPVDGTLVLDLTRLDRLDPVDGPAGQATVGAGVTLGRLQEHAATAGLRYGVDLAARDSATVGGTVATNAGGVHVLRWGSTRRQVVGIEAVLADGRVVSHLGGLVKDATGYDLAGLLCGSEGTLGVVTAVRVRLVAPPRHQAVALLGVRSPATAVGALARWRQGIADLSALELVDGPVLELVCQHLGLPAPLAGRWPAYVLVEAAGDDPVGSLARALGADPDVEEVAVAEDAAGRHRLWRYRDGATEAINRLGPPIKLDVALPHAGLAPFLARVPATVAAVAPGARTWCFGHLGDGNVHVNVTAPAAAGVQDDAIEAAVLALVGDLGGAVSGEHGIGRAKRRWLHLSRSPEEIAVFRSIKSALDPDGILAPGVLLPDP